MKTHCSFPPSRSASSLCSGRVNRYGPCTSGTVGDNKTTCYRRGRGRYLVVVSCLLALQSSGSCANPLGIEVMSVEEAKPVLKAHGSPSLGNKKRLVVVKHVDSEGPCHPQLLPGCALEKINGVVIDSTEQFESACESLRPGDLVTLEGLYVSAVVGRRRRWVNGKAEVRIPVRNDGTPDKDGPPMAISQATGVGMPVIGKQSQQAPKGDEDDRELLQSNPTAFAMPRITIDSDLPGYEDFGANATAFCHVKYSKGPRGQTIFTLYVGKEGWMGSKVWPVTMEGFVVGEPSPHASMSPIKLQSVLHRAYKEGRFCTHGRYVRWYPGDNLPSWESICGEKMQSDEGAAQRSARLESFAWEFDGEKHGLRCQWSPDGRRKCKAIYVHGVVHGLEEEWGDDEEYDRSPYRFGLANGVAERFYGVDKPRQRSSAINGKKTGLDISWWYNGTIMTQQTWKEGELDGLSESFHENGQRSSLCLFRMGRLAADEQVWDEQGNPLPGEKAAVEPARGLRSDETLAKKGLEGNGPYEFGFQQGVAMGQDDYLLIKTMEARGGGLKDVLGRITGRLVKFRGELVEAEASVAKGADSRLLDVAKGRYEGYVKELGPYGKQ